MVEALRTALRSQCRELKSMARNNETPRLLPLFRVLSHTHRARAQRSEGRAGLLPFAQGRATQCRFPQAQSPGPRACFGNRQRQCADASLAILEWLEETHPNPPMLPKDPIARAKVRAFAMVIALRDSSGAKSARAQQCPCVGHGDAEVNEWARRTNYDGLAACEKLLADTKGPFCLATRPRWRTSASSRSSATPAASARMSQASSASSKQRQPASPFRPLRKLLGKATRRRIRLSLSQGPAQAGLFCAGRPY